MMERFISRCALPLDGLAVFRRGLGLLCMLDALLRLPYHAFWLTDLGVLPRSLYFRLYEDSLVWSLYSISGRLEFSLTLLLLTVVLGGLQLAGRSSRGLRVALWLLVLSVQHRNPFLMDSADDLLRLLLFWDMFLPQEQSRGGLRASPATVGLQIQLSLGLAGMSWACWTGWIQSAVWSLNERAFWTPWFGMVAAGYLALLVVAVWLRPIRRSTLVCGVPVLAWWAVTLHPWMPLVVAVGVSALWGKGETEVESRGGRRWHSFGYLFIYLIIILQAVPVIAEAARAMAWSAGLQQSWNRVYPLVSTTVVELTASESGTGNAVWSIGADSDRRSRIWAQEVAEQEALTEWLSDSLEYRFSGLAAPKISMKQTELLPDHTLGRIEVRLLTDTPVWSLTRGRLDL